MSERTCSIDGCENTSRKRGWCDKHYTRWLRNGDPETLKPRLDRRCSVDGCDLKHDSHGYCLRHAAMWRRHGDPTYSDTPAQSCLLPWCDEPARVKGRASSACSVAHNTAAWQIMKHGLELEEFVAMVQALDGRCEACGEIPPRRNPHRPTGLVIDHDHDCCPGNRSCGKCVRGLLCIPCNALATKANNDRRMAVAAYLQRKEN